MLHLTRFLLMGFMFISLASFSFSTTTTTTHESKSETVSVIAKKQSFLHRFLHGFAEKTPAEVEKADRHANTSLWTGISAFGAILIGLAVPFVILASIPLGIIAITSGSAALNNKTTREGAARTGRGLGIGALATFAAILILTIVVLAAWLSAW